MSGQAAVRGFTYQTIISVIRSLNNDDWDFVTIEPKTDLEKVDIIWQDAEGHLICEQVKSSINNFTKTNTLSWLEQMISDVNHAKKYQLTLIGPTSADLVLMSKSIKENQPTGSKILNAAIDLLNIELVTFNIDFLESRVRDEVHKFLSNAEYNVPHPSIDLIAKGLIYQFFQFSVLGKKVNRSEFVDHLLSWVKFNYSKTLGINTSQSQFGVFFYDKNEHRFSTEQKLEHTSLKLDNSGDINSLINNINRNYNKAFKITLPVKTPNVSDIKKMMERLESLKTSPLSTPTTAEVPDYMRDVINDGMKKYFNLEVPMTFFEVGQLEKTTSISIGMSPNLVYNYQGTTAEKSKWDAIRSVYWDIQAVNQLKLFTNNINEFFSLILCIENAGSIYDEEILVRLIFPDSIEMLKPQNLHIPNDLEFVEKLIEDDFADQILKIQADSQVKIYPHTNHFDIERWRNLDTLYRISDHSKKLKMKTEELFGSIEKLMDFEIYEDLPDQKVLQFNFKQINPGIRMGFPCVLYVKAKEDFSFQYEIKSKHNGKTYNGILRCSL